MVVVNEVELQEPGLRDELPYFRNPTKGGTRGPSQYRPRYSLPEDADYDGNQIITIMPDSRLPRPGIPVYNPEFMYPPRRMDKGDQFTALSALCTLVSLVSYMVDFGTDIAVSYLFFMEGRHWWFGLTAAFTALPAITVNAFSLRWYMHDESEKKMSEPFHRPRGSASKWALRILFHIVFLGPLIRYIDLLCYGFKSRKRRRQKEKGECDWPRTPVRIEQPDDVDYYLLMIHEDRDTALLSLLKSFMESAPQLVLQIYILTNSPHEMPQQLTVFMQLASVAASLFELAWSLASYHRALRRSVPDKKNMTRTGTALQFLWRFCTIGARACTLALFATEYNYWLFPLCIGHWGVMSVWVMHQQTRFCDTETGEPRQCEEYLFNMVIGAIYLFCFLNVKDEPTRYKYIAYYTIAFTENSILIVLWFLKCNPNHWFHMPALIGVFGSFAAGMVFMLIYYGFFHPNGRLPLVNRSAKCC